MVTFAHEYNSRI